jgi:hypothetical protein
VPSVEATAGPGFGCAGVNNDGSPGANITVRQKVGGLASYGNGPLWWTDIQSGGINNINPSDIASIDVLKDASATAICGIGLLMAW